MQKSDFKLSNFKATMKARGVARPSRFEILLFPPVSSKIHGAGIIDISIRCHSGSMPPFNVDTKDFMIGQGQITKMPVGYNNGHEQTFSFYNDTQSAVYADLLKWAKMVTATKAENDYSLNYYKDFIGKVVVKQLDEQDNVRFEYTLFEAYPLAVDAIELKSDITDTAELIHVKFAYRYARAKDEIENAPSLSITTRRNRPSVKQAPEPSSTVDYTMNNMPKRIKEGLRGVAQQYDQCKADSDWAYSNGEYVFTQQRNQWPQEKQSVESAVSSGEPSLVSSAWESMKATYANISENATEFFGNTVKAIKSYTGISSDIPVDDPLHTDINNLKAEYKKVSEEQAKIDVEHHDYEKIANDIINATNEPTFTIEA